MLLGVRVIADEDQQLLSGQPGVVVELLPLPPQQANPPDNTAAAVAALDGALVRDGERAAPQRLVARVSPSVQRYHATLSETFGRETNRLHLCGHIKAIDELYRELLLHCPRRVGFLPTQGTQVCLFYVAGIIIVEVVERLGRLILRALESADVRRTQEYVFRARQLP